MLNWEILSYMVTVIGFPFAISVFLFEKYKEREKEEEAIWQQLSDSYIKFLEIVLANPDLRLRSQPATLGLDKEQHERMLIIFDMLISLFERAYLLAWPEKNDGKTTTTMEFMGRLHARVVPTRRFSPTIARIVARRRFSVFCLSFTVRLKTGFHSNIHKS